MKPTILDAMQDAELFGPIFAGDSWKPWRVFLASAFGLRVEGGALETFRACTGRDKPPERPAKEIWAIAGRRAGKSRIAALIAVFAACFRDYSAVLGRGERGVVMVIAQDRRQARVVMQYVRALLDEVPLLSAMVLNRRKESIDLNNGVTIEIHSASFRSVRGYTVLLGVLDELAFWRSDESADPDFEVVRALRPAMVTVPDAMLIGISSPYSRRGVLWQAYRQHYGKDGDVLVWQADTAAMNPNVDESTIEAAYEADPIAAASEWGAEFRSDLDSYITEEAVQGVTVADRLELEPLTGVTYSAFVDPSGGARDSFTLAIGHREKDAAVLDCVRERKAPFSPESVVADFCKTLKTYRVHKVAGDRYAAEWSRSAFEKNGIEYRPAQYTKSGLYQELLPLVNSKRVELLDLVVLQVQLCGLERRTGRGGKDSVDHPPGARDDVANCVAGVLVGLADRGANLEGVSMAVNDEFASRSDFGSQSWSYTDEGVKGATDGEIMRDWSRRQNE